MVNAKILYDFMTHFDLARTDVKVDSDGHYIWFEKPSGERWPLEFTIFEDESYEITIFKDNIYENGDGEDVILETGIAIASKEKRIEDETNI